MDREELSNYNQMSILAFTPGFTKRGIVYDGAFYRLDVNFDETTDIKLKVSRYGFENVCGVQPMSERSLSNFESAVLEALKNGDSSINIPVEIERI